MDLKPNPFSVYDFLGYFTPGAMVLYGGIVAYGHAVHNANATDSIQLALGKESGEIYVPFVILCYLVGHLASFLSSVTVERYSVWRHGYPSKYLVGLDSKGYLEVDQPKLLFGSARLLVAFALAPISIFDGLISALPSGKRLYARPLDKFLKETVLAKSAQTLRRLNIHHASERESSGNLSEDSFRVLYHYAVENAPTHYPKMQNYVALYGFLRTVTLLGIAFFWVAIWHWCVHDNWGAHGLWIVICAVALCNLSFAAFIKFYRRFSLETLMAISAMVPDAV